MWRAVLRSMYSSGLKPLTSPAILQSKIVVSKCVIRPIPETPSIMFDHTVSTSFPIGVMKPMPVTATRRPLELDVMTSAYGRRGQSTLAPCGKTGLNAWTSCPSLDQIRQLQQLSDLQCELQPQPRRRNFKVSAEQLPQLVEPVEDRVAMEPESGGGFLHSASHEVSLQRLQELHAVAHLGVDQAPEAVGNEALRQSRVLRQHEVGDELVVAVNHAFRAQLSPGLDRLLRLEIRPRDASQAGVITADARADASPRRARALDRLILELGYKLAGVLDVRHRLGRPEHDEGARVRRMADCAAGHLKGGCDLGQRLPAPLTIAVADDQLADRDHVAGGDDRHVEGKRLFLKLQLGVEVVADQGVEEARVRPGAALHVLFPGV